MKTKTEVVREMLLSITNRQMVFTIILVSCLSAASLIADWPPPDCSAGGACYDPSWNSPSAAGWIVNALLTPIIWVVKLFT